MKKIYTLGLSQILIGDIAQDGGMGQSLTQFGYTKADSCTFEQDDPEVTDFNAEEVDDPVISIAKAGKINFNFELMNPDVAVMVELFGGTKDESNNTWSAPEKMPTIEKSVTIIPDQGFKFMIPRMKIVAKIVGGFSNTGMMTISVAGTVLQPTKAGVSKLTLAELTSEDTKVATPTFTPSSWTEGTTLSLTMSTATDGATIYYTTDGTTTPTSESTEYTAAITLSATTTIKAIAIKEGMTASDVATGTFTKPA